MDVFQSAGHQLAILDISATAHMPDVIEMPYRPDVFLVDENASDDAQSQPAVRLENEHYQLATEPDGSGNPEFTYRLGGPTCLAGDVVGDYHFSRKLKVGDTLVFDDMAHYTMVKTTTFNGVKHPPIALLHEDGSMETVRKFSYEDFRDRLS
jgi:carboxynorspermidine decarboxylase